MKIREPRHEGEGKGRKRKRNSPVLNCSNNPAPPPVLAVGGFLCAGLGPASSFALPPPPSPPPTSGKSSSIAESSCRLTSDGLEVRVGRTAPESWEESDGTWIASNEAEKGSALVKDREREAAGKREGGFEVGGSSWCVKCGGATAATEEGGREVVSLWDWEDGGCWEEAMRGGGGAEVSL